MSPRKVRLVADLVRGMDVVEAEKHLQFTSKRSAKPILKLLQSAVATALNDFEYKKDNLKIAKIIVNEGPTLKRWRPRAYGRAYQILKRTSHVSIELEEKIKSQKKKSKADAKKAEKAADIKDAGKGIEARKKGHDKKKMERSDKEFGKKIQKDQSKGILKKVFRRKSV